MKKAQTGGALPPAKRGGSRYDWDTITAELQEQPGDWLLIGEGVPRGIGSAINSGRIVRLRGADGWTYRAATRNNRGIVADLWMTATPIEKPPPRQERKSSAT